MNRWWGSAEDAEQQAGDRNSRAARRTLARQTVVSSGSEDEAQFYNANDQSLSFPNLDGENDEAIEAEDMAAAAAELARQRALPVDQANFENDSDSWKKENI